MRNILYTTLLIFALSCTSCEGFLEKNPNTGIVVGEAMNTVADSEQILLGIYNGLLGGSLYTGYLTLLPDIQSDFVYAINGFSNTYGAVWRWDFQSTTSEIQSVYSALYNLIMRCNYFLDNYEKVKGNTTDRDELLYLELYTGQVYNCRALAYAELLKLYCEPYDKDNAERQHGVSITDSFEIKEKYVQRSNMKDSYRFVMDDLQRAEEHLTASGMEMSDCVANAPDFNLATVNALRARLCLYMQDWDGALEYSTRVIDNKNYTLCNAVFTTTAGYYTDYFNMWWYDQGTEVIMRIGMTSTNYGSSLSWPFHHYDFVNLTPDFVPASWVLNSYSGNDFRTFSFFAEAETAHTHRLTWPLLTKYYTNPNIDGTGIPKFVNMPKIFRLSEQYLIRAEANYMLDNVTEANDDLTQIRKKRISGYGTSNYSGQTLFNEIKSERVKELYMEGFRLQDLKRWGEGFTRRPQSESLSTGDRLSVTPDNPRFVWPIPQHEVDSNPGIYLNESNK